MTDKKDKKTETVKKETVSKDVKKVEPLKKPVVVENATVVSKSPSRKNVEYPGKRKPTHTGISLKSLIGYGFFWSSTSEVEDNIHADIQEEKKHINSSLDWRVNQELAECPDVMLSRFETDHDRVIYVDESSSYAHQEHDPHYVQVKNGSSDKTGFKEILILVGSRIEETQQTYNPEIGVSVLFNAVAKNVVFQNNNIILGDGCKLRNHADGRFFFPNVSPTNLEKATLRNCVVLGRCNIAKVYARDSNFFDAKIDAFGQIKNGVIEGEIKAKHVDINQSTIKGNIHVTERLYMSNHKWVERKYTFRTPELHVSGSSGFSEFSVAGETPFFVFGVKGGVVVQRSYNYEPFRYDGEPADRPMLIKLNKSFNEYEQAAQIRRFVEGRPVVEQENSGFNPDRRSHRQSDPIQRSIMDYLCDSISSRVKLIQTISSALRLADSVNTESNRDDCPF